MENLLIQRQVKRLIYILIIPLLIIPQMTVFAGGAHDVDPNTCLDVNSVICEACLADLLANTSKATQNSLWSTLMITLVILEISAILVMIGYNVYIRQQQTSNFET